MCLGTPARVVAVDPGDNVATVDDRGRLRRASTLRIERVAVGDWVLLAAGNVIRRLDPADAADLAARLVAAEAAATAPPTPAPRHQGDLS
ncbi:MAG: HypC/HybG/HupF family hydrogenase formation chaperone [Chloroflexi bacterium]|nr:HypC/HybG/HupF family hydrogenase formation chaperone [Chloroflexota bacterium]